MGKSRPCDAEVGKSLRVLSVKGEKGGGELGWRRSRERNRRLKMKCKSPHLAADRGIFYDEDKGRCIRIYVGSRKRVMQRVSNKKVRRYKRDFANHGGYRIIYDLWWELF